MIHDFKVIQGNHLAFTKRFFSFLDQLQGMFIRHQFGEIQILVVNGFVQSLTSSRSSLLLVVVATKT